MRFTEPSAVLSRMFTHQKHLSAQGGCVFLRVEPPGGNSHILLNAYWRFVRSRRLFPATRFTRGERPNLLRFSPACSHIKNTYPHKADAYFCRWSHLAGSNRRPTGYKSVALPAELRWRQKKPANINVQDGKINFFLYDRRMKYVLGDIEIAVHLGITPEERAVAQPVLVTVTFTADASKAAQSDNIADTKCDYQHVYDQIHAFSGREYNLIEKLSADIKHTLKEAFPQCENLTLSLTKFPFEDGWVQIIEA